MKNKKIVILFALVFSLVFSGEVFSIPPHPIITTSISTPPSSGNNEEILEINFSINATNQITLNSIAIKNLAPAIVNTGNNTYALTITDSNNNILFKSNILVIFDSSGISKQYYAIPYPSGAKYLNFYYQNQQIARYDVPQEFPWLYVAIGIIAVVIVLIIYFISRKYTIQI